VSNAVNKHSTTKYVSPRVRAKVSGNGVGHSDIVRTFIHLAGVLKSYIVYMHYCIHYQRCSVINT